MISIDAGLLAALAGFALIGFVMWCAFAMVRDDSPRRDGMWVLPYDPDAAYDPLEAVGGVPAPESADVVPLARVVGVLGDYAITTRTAQPRRVLPGEIASRLLMESPASSREDSP